MSELSADDVRKVARLARLRLEEAEVEDERTRLAAVLGYVERLQSLDLDGVEPLAHVGEQTNRLDPDEVGGHLPNQTLMDMAPQTDPPFVRVPKVLGEGGGA